MIFGLISIAILYILTAIELLNSLETVISKHPLFIYSVIVLGILILISRMVGKAKTIIAWIFAFFLLMYYISLKG